MEYRYTNVCTGTYTVYNIFSKICYRNINFRWLEFEVVLVYLCIVVWMYNFNISGRNLPFNSGKTPSSAPAAFDFKNMQHSLSLPGSTAQHLQNKLPLYNLFVCMGLWKLRTNIMTRWLYDGHIEMLDDNLKKNICLWTKISSDKFLSARVIHRWPTVEHRELDLMLCGDLNGKEILRRRDVCSDRFSFLGLQNHCRWWLQPWN